MAASTIKHAALEKTVTPITFTHIYSTKKSSLQDVIMVVLPSQSGHAKTIILHFAHGRSFYLHGGLKQSRSSLPAAWVPYQHHTKKLATWHKLVSNQRIFKMCVRKMAFLFIKNLHSYIYVKTYSMVFLLYIYECEYLYSKIMYITICILSGWLLARIQERYV